MQGTGAVASDAFVSKPNVAGSALVYSGTDGRGFEKDGRLPSPRRIVTKERVLGEMLRVLKPDGRLYLSDIVVHKPVPESAKQNIDLWTD